MAMAQVGIAFVGQCLVHGYPGVPRSATYPEIVRHHLERERPGLRVRVVAEPFYHPAELQRVLERLLRSVQPDLVVIDVAGWLVANGPTAVDLSRLPWGVRSAYDRVRHLRSVSYGLAARWPGGRGLVMGVQASGRAVVDGPLRFLVKRYPRPSLEEYERLLEEAVALVTRQPGCELVLQGPSSFNPAETDPACVPESVVLYRAVNDLARRVAAMHGVTFVDRMSLINSADGDMFLPGSTRLSDRGHQLTGHAVAETLLRGGLI